LTTKQKSVFYLCLAEYLANGQRPALIVALDRVERNESLWDRSSAGTH
jgi:hypothetical protein